MGCIAPVEKFAGYIFKPGATHGKDHVFRSLGYSGSDSEYLAVTYEQQAAAKYASGAYTFGRRDEHGQRISIEIELRGIGAAADRTSHLLSEWMIQADGSIRLNTPFSGFAR